MVRTILLLALGAALPACGGRARLAEDTGRSYAQVWQSQIESQPKEKLAPFTAREAAVAMGNHRVRYDKGGVTATPGGAGFGGGMGGGGLLTPATTDLGSLGLGGESDGGGGPGDRNIRLDAK